MSDGGLQLAFASNRKQTLDEVKAMSDEERDQARICRLCWEPYEVCRCRERSARRKALKQ